MTITSISIPQAHLLHSESLFSPTYTVPATQVYEVHYCYQSTFNSVRRRYSHFHALNTLIKRTDGELQEVAFPGKKWIGSCSAQVVEARRLGLQAWLMYVAGQTKVLTHVLDFLQAAQVAAPVTPTSHTSSEQTITQTLSRLASQPHMRLATLEAFEKEFFELKTPTNTDYILAFVQKLVPICGDNYIGCKAISILMKLASSEHYRGYMDVVRSLRQLPMVLLRQMSLEKHLLHAMSDESFRLTRILSQENDSKTSELVPCTQLNACTEAMTVYTHWCNGSLPSHLQPQAKTSHSWREIDCSDCLYLRILYKASIDGIEVKTELRVNAPIDRVVRLLTEAQERKKWDTRTKDVVQLDQRGNTSFLMVFDLPGKESSCTLDCHLTRTSPNKVLISLSTKEDDQSQIRFKSTYSVSTVDCAEESTGRTHGIASFPLSDSQTNDGNNEHMECVITNELSGNTVLTRVFASEIAGEVQTFKSSWREFKRLAEGFLRCNCVESELNRAMDRKVVMGRSHLQSFHRPTLSSSLRRLCTSPARMSPGEYSRDRK